MRPAMGVDSFPVLKYSFAPDRPTSASRLDWKHLHRDLAVELDKSPATGARGSRPPQSMRVLQGMQVLDDIPLEHLCSEAQAATAQCLQLRVQLRKEQLPISAIISRPKCLLAIRYHLPHSKLVRRMQVKFKLGSDFDTVYEHLLSLGVPLDTPQRPSTAQPAPICESSLDLPVSAGPSCPPSRLVEHSNRPFTAATTTGAQANSNLSTARLSLFDSSPKISSPLAQRPLIVGSSSAENLPSRPGSTHPCGEFPETAFITHSNQESGSFQGPGSASSGSRLSSDLVTDPVHVPVRPLIENLQSFSPSRPSSPTIGQQAIPPRRELPFSRPTPPKSSDSDKTQTSSRNPSDLMPPPDRPASAHWVGHKSGPMPAFGERPVTLTPDPVARCERHHRRRRSITRPRSASTNITRSTTDLPPLPEPTFLQQGSDEQRPCTSQAWFGTALPHEEHDGLQSCRQSLSNANTTASAAISVLATLPSPTVSESSVTEHMLSKLDKNMCDSSNALLASYATQPDENRMATLNDFMMQQLENSHFIRLCEDVSVCWARIGLGLE